MQLLHNIPTNIVTGFLGSGKTTLISHLLKHKPDNERWAVLVNEFGTAGVDGGLLAQPGDTQEVFIREVPGGCLCCAAGLPAQLAINSLLARARPHRLIIEPTGLGHPLEVLELLQSEHYAGVIDLKATLTLVDARKLQDPRYRTHETFLQQLQVADRIIASKADLCDEADLEALQQFAREHDLSAATKITPAVLGDINLNVLDEPCTQVSTETAKPAPPLFTMNSPETRPVTSPGDSAIPGAILEFPEEGYLTFDNQADGYVSLGWVFHPSAVFSYRQLRELLESVDAVRVKAVLITDEGIVGYNRAEDLTSEVYLEETTDSRIEMIGLAPPTKENPEIPNDDSQINTLGKNRLLTIESIQQCLLSQGNNHTQSW